MNNSKSGKFHKRTKEELNNFIKKLDLQALETAEERLPLYLDVGLKDSTLVLDVGCGSGFVTRDIARLTKGTVIAIDGSPSLIDVSKKILKGLLREALGFHGLLISDDLEMGAVVERYSLEVAAIAALNAGADLLLVCNDMEKVHMTAGAIRDGLHRGLLDPQDLALSLTKIENLRRNYLQPLRLADAVAVATHFSV